MQRIWLVIVHPFDLQPLSWTVTTVPPVRCDVGSRAITTGVMMASRTTAANLTYRILASHTSGGIWGQTGPVENLQFGHLRR